MVTIYELLEVNENASKEEIEKSYQNLILEYQKNPNLSEEENNQNEMILNKLKIAYEILSNDEKRKKYDNDLAKKRAEDLIKNVAGSTKENVKKNEDVKSSEVQSSSAKNTYDSNNSVGNNDENTTYANQNSNDEELTQEEQEKLRKAAREEFDKNLKKAEKAQAEYNQAYNEAYKEYLKKMGYNNSGKQAWTLKRIKTIIITIFAIILVCAIAWIIPPVRELLIGIYEENIIVKSLVDLTAMLVKAVLSIFKQ